ncbi:unnamed protein product [Citrullus colocynthis]|uniref:Uncharacterized protein n=1 Tax=Citrullus colocynthis TaxID=252529 RepID=A0ABP0YBY3_9ROSI
MCSQLEYFVAMLPKFEIHLLVSQVPQSNFMLMRLNIWHPLPIGDLAVISFSFDRHSTVLNECNAIAFKSCREIEGPFIDYLEAEFRKPLLPAGVVDLQPLTTTLEERWGKWLSEFNSGSVIYCEFGSECTLTRNQFQELLLGLELTNLPFFAALKPPHGIDTVGAALLEGFEQRIQGRGVVYGGCVQQQQILEHPSIGCFITQCGSGSLSEALVKK